MTISPVTGTNKWYGLDHLRAIAILQVFFFHYGIISRGAPAWLPDWAAFGWTGVDLFFVLSGFLISSQLFAEIRRGEALSLRTFFLKRIFRIIPAYLVTLALYFFVPFFRERESLPPFWRFISCTQNFGLNIQTNGTFSHAWSLCVEEHFYLFLPLTLWLISFRKPWRYSSLILVFIFLAGFVLRMYSYEHLYVPHANDEDEWRYWYQYIYYPTYNRLDGLLVGISIAAIYVFKPILWQRWSKWGYAWLATGFFVLAGAWFLCRDQETFSASVFGFPLVAIGYGLLVMAALSPVTFLYRNNSRITSFIATTSYALYLTHKGIIKIITRWLRGNTDQNLVLLIALLSAITLAYLLHVLIEKPFTQWRKRITIKKQSPANT